MRRSDSLESRAVTVDFGGLRALDNVEIVLRRGDILGLIGPNGAGKTTLLNAMTGFQKVTKGDVYLDDQRISRWSPERIARMGIARTFQAMRPFPDLSVLENVQVGPVGVGVSPTEARRRAVELINWMNLASQAHSQARSLSAGDERRLGVIRALAMHPRFILMDEPAAGLNESETDDLLNAILMIRDQYGCGILVIEHDMALIMGLCDRVQVLDFGRTIALGSPEEIQANPAVVTAYLGTAVGVDDVEGQQPNGSVR